LTNSYGLTLSADGREWIVGNYRDLAHIDPVSLQTLATVTSPIFGSSTLMIEDPVTSSDGTIAVFGDVYYNCGSLLMVYEPRSRTYRLPTPDYEGCRGTVGASGDGSRLLVLNHFDVFGTDDVLSLDTTAATTTPTGLHLLTGKQPRMDLTGSRIVLDDTRVYDGQYTPLGQLPATTLAVVLAPDGARAYTFDSSGSMRTFDLQAAATGGFMNEIGTATTLAGDPGITTPPELGEMQMAITPDGETIFIAGSRAVIVQPAP
jgi:hypothetical protein